MIQTAEVAFRCDATLGEGPVWLAESGRLLWFDMVTGRVFLAAPRGAVSAVEVGGRLGSVRERRRGGFAVAPTARSASWTSHAGRAHRNGWSAGRGRG